MINLKLYGWWVFLLTSAVLAIQVLLNEVPGDSKVFFQTGLNVRNNVDPWLESSDPVNFQYLNGPLFSLICYIFSFFGSHVMYLLTCVLSIAITPICVILAARLLKIETDSRYLGFISATFMLTFSFRANLEYGQFVIFYFLLFLYILVIHNLEKPSRAQQFLVGIGILMLLDFKPHIFIFMVFLLFRYKSRYVIKGFLVGVLFELLVLKLVSGNFLPYEWAARLLNRGRNSDGLSGYYNLPNFLSELSIPDNSSKYLLPIILVILLVISIFHRNSIWVTCLLIFWALNPLMHPQDFLPLVLFALLVISRNKGSILIYFILGQSIVWSTNLSMIFFSSIVISLTLFFFYPIERLTPRIIGFTAFISPITLINWAKYFQSSPDSYRAILNICSILGMYIILSSRSRKIGLSDLLRSHN